MSVLFLFMSYMYNLSVLSCPNRKIDWMSISTSNVESIDTAGIQLLASCRNSALARGKTFSIALMSEPVREALQITGLQQIFENKEIA